MSKTATDWSEINVISAGARQLDSVTGRVFTQNETVHAVTFRLHVQRQWKHLPLDVANDVEIDFLLPLRSKTYHNWNTEMHKQKYLL